jgi:peptidoglycan/LPS O-acetylase OafA/YrhL
MLPPEALRNQLIGGSEYDRYFYEFHSPTHLNGGNYLIGLLIGYFYYQYRKENERKIHYRRTWFQILWHLSYLTTFVLSLSGIFFYENDMKLGVLSALLGTFLKHIYGPVLGILLVGIFLRYGHFIPKVFNYGMYRVLARLSFSVYMVHFTVG